MARILTLVLVCSATAATAAPRLFPQPSMLTLLPDAALTEAPPADPHVPTLVASGAAAALFSTPAALLLGAWVGTLSNNLYAALIPSLLIAGLVPSIATVVTEWMVAERSGKGRFRLVETDDVLLAANPACFIRRFVWQQITVFLYQLLL